MENLAKRNKKTKYGEKLKLYFKQFNNKKLKRKILEILIDENFSTQNSCSKNIFEEENNNSDKMPTTKSSRNLRQYIDNYYYKSKTCNSFLIKKIIIKLKKKKKKNNLN